MKAVYSALVASLATGLAVFGMMEYPRADDGSATKSEVGRIVVPKGDARPAAPLGGASATVQELSRSFVQIAKEVRPSVVVIETGGSGEEGQRSPWQAPNERRGMGSGFIIDLEKGYVLTNAHVVGGSSTVSVTTFDRRRYDARVVGAEPGMDVAVVQIEGLKGAGLQAVKWGDSDAVEVGEMVLALGAPFGLSQTLTHGIVSAVGRGDLPGAPVLEELLQTDAPINPGNSGGPLLNLRGQVIGINTAISSPSGASAGIGFAVPSRVARMAGEMLIRDGRVTRGYLGMQGDDADAAMVQLKLPTNVRGGALVTAVEPDSPAAAGGLRPYDVITEIDGRPIGNFAQLRSAVAFLKPGMKVPVTYFREGRQEKGNVAIGQFPERVAMRERR